MNDVAGHSMLHNMSTDVRRYGTLNVMYITCNLHVIVIYNHKEREANIVSRTESAGLPQSHQMAPAERRDGEMEAC